MDPLSSPISSLTTTSISLSNVRGAGCTIPDPSPQEDVLTERCLSTQQRKDVAPILIRLREHGDGNVLS